MWGGYFFQNSYRIKCDTALESWCSVCFANFKIIIESSWGSEVIGHVKCLLSEDSENILYNMFTFLQIFTNLCECAGGLNGKNQNFKSIIESSVIHLCKADDLRFLKTWCTICLPFAHILVKQIKSWIHLLTIWLWIICSYCTS